MEVECQPNGDAIAVGWAVDTSGVWSQLLVQAGKSGGYQLKGDPLLFTTDLVPAGDEGYRLLAPRSDGIQIHFLDTNLEETRPMVTVPLYETCPALITLGTMLPDGKMILMSECDEGNTEHSILFQRVDADGNVERELERGDFDRNFIGGLATMDDGSIMFSFYGRSDQSGEGFDASMIGQMDPDLNNPPGGPLTFGPTVVVK